MIKRIKLQIKVNASARHVPSKILKVKDIPRTKNGKIAICLIDGEFTVKRIKKEKDKFYLMPENKKYKPIELKEDNELIIWGVVEYVIKKV